MGLLKKTAEEAVRSKTVADAAKVVSTAVTAVTSAVSAAAMSAAAQTSSVKKEVEEKVVDLQDDLEQFGGRQSCRKHRRAETDAKRRVDRTGFLSSMSSCDNQANASEAQNCMHQRAITYQGSTKNR